MIINESIVFNKETIEKIEETYKAVYVCDSQLKSKDGGWSYNPAAIFYTAQPHPEGSEYFGMYRKDDEIYITNGISATEPFDGVVTPSGDIIYSRYRHDYREHGGVFIDGGRDYTRKGGSKIPETVKLRISGSTLVVDK
jgi:hypothetical protein